MKAKLIKTENGYGLEDVGIIAFYSSKRPVHKHYKLSKQNCDEIFGVVDVEKYVDEYAAEWEYTERIGFRDGFNEAMELNKDKVFTLEQVHKLLRLVHILPNFELEQFEDENNVLQIDTFISHHIQQPTEIDVVIEMECVMGCQNLILNGENSVCCGDKKPKLDSDGCLILKKV
jgi:hypothetical protein